jgi:hypothetical protein
MRPYIICIILTFNFIIKAQTSAEAIKKDLTYYLPNISYDKNITTPESYFGFQIGEWHISHDQVVGYMKLLAKESTRIEIKEYARSHENRMLLTLYISTEENLKNKDEIKRRHNLLTEDKNASIENLPVVLYQGYSIHGNEPSGINAAMMVAYYLAAGQSEEVTTLLKETFIILDPCYNPDGVTRFSTWANSHKGKNLISDPASREYNEMWPGGRTNHYWFDLNRDWLLLTHPESRGRVKHFQEWKPNILTDHHEMGTNSTFFFQPGVPSRVNQNTPWINQELTEEIATYHASALDAIGSLYYSKEGFDDYYFGKGSTYPDIQGGIGILFEQASSRGHYQESENGVLSFPFTIRNQVVTSLSTQKAAVAMHKKLLEYKRSSYEKAALEAASSPIKGYLIYDKDEVKLNQMIEVLLHHGILIYPTASDIKINANQYPKESTFFIPMQQKQSKLVKTCFEKVRTFQDSIFYDVSAWTLPLAYDIQYDEVKDDQYQKISKKEVLTATPFNAPNLNLADNAYAYTVAWNQAFAPAFLNELLNKNVFVKALTSDTKIAQLMLKAGTLIIPSSNQKLEKTALIEAINTAAKKFNVKVQNAMTGSSEADLSLGHPDVMSMTNVKPFTIVGQGISSYDAGELWHYMDHRVNTAISLVDKKDLNKVDYTRYNTLILVDGNYNDLSEATVKNIEEWVKKGNTIIALSSSIDFLRSKNIIKLTKADEEKSKPASSINYDKADEIKGAKVVGGSIFNTDADLTHPLCFGVNDKDIALFKQGSTIYKPTENTYATPIKYAQNNTILSGYIPKGFDNKLKGSPAATVHNSGSGTIVCFVDNVLFRGYWWGGFKLFSNALYFAKAIERDTKENE